MVMADDQRDVIDFLSRPSSYGAAVERVDIIETHVSLVFLAGDRGYKLKRSVKFPYLDFSSAEQRRLIEASHHNDPIDDATLGPEANPTIRGAGQRSDLQIKVRRRTAVEHELGLASCPALFRGREVKVGKLC